MAVLTDISMVASMADLLVSYWGDGKDTLMAVMMVETMDCTKVVCWAGPKVVS